MMSLHERDPLHSSRLDPDSVRGGRVLVLPNGMRFDASTMDDAIPLESGRLAVILPEAGYASIPELARRLRHHVPARWESIRLIGARAAACARPSEPAPAQT